MGNGNSRHDIVALLVCLGNLVLFCLTLSSVWMRIEEHVQQSCHRGIRLGVTNSSPTCWASVGMFAGSSRGLPGKPFSETGATEGVKAVEQGEGLVEDVCTDLSLSVSILYSVQTRQTDRTRQFLLQVERSILLIPHSVPSFASLFAQHLHRLFSLVLGHCSPLLGSLGLTCLDSTSRSQLKHFKSTCADAGKPSTPQITNPTCTHSLLSTSSYY